MKPSHTENSIRVLLVEDEPLWQEAIDILLKPDSRFNLVGVAASYELAIETFQQVDPQLVLLDWKIQGLKDGLEAGQFFLEQGLASEKIILISSSPADAIPAHPFLHIPKNRLADDLLPLLAGVTTS
jgi:DNA-binding NarL/FixJ family response regulator